MTQIRIVLVEPSHPGNIGGAARAMKTMGLSSLSLVRPQRFPDPQVDWRAAGALEIVENIEVHESIEDAVAGSSLVAGTSARDRHIPWPIVSAEQFAESLVRDYDPNDEVSVLFGREDSGLSNDELNLCNQQIKIPSSNEYGSLNLAMSVQVVAYEIFKATARDDILTKPWDRPRAVYQEIEDFYEHMESVLTRIGFYDPESPKEAMTRLRRLFGRVQLDHTEVQILRGILTHVEQSIITH